MNEKMLFSVKDIAVITSQSEKATRRMGLRAQQALSPIFDFRVGEHAIDYSGIRFVDLVALENNSTLQAAVRETKGYKLKEGISTEVISGICLFGYTGLTVFAEDGEKISLTDPTQWYLQRLRGKKVVDVVTSEFLHPSEVENVLRLTTAFQTLGRMRNAEQNLFQLNMHMPTTEYKLNMLTLYHTGSISGEQFTKLCELIEQRASNLESMIAKRIPTQFNVHFLEPFKQYERRLLQTSSYEEVLSIVKSDPILGNYFQDTPHSMAYLTKRLYTVVYFLLSQEAKRKGSNCLAVETYEEMPILKEAETTMGSLDATFAMTALYLPLTTVARKGIGGYQDLFWYKGNTTIEDLKTVIKQARSTDGSH